LERRGELNGTTLRVYRYVVKARAPVRVTDVQARLRLSSPSLAHYHLRKLIDLGLVREEGLGYVADKVAIENFFLFRGRIVPFQAAYASFFCVTMAAMLLILAMSITATITSFEFIALAANASAVSVSVYELRRALRTVL